MKTGVVRRRRRRFGGTQCARTQSERVRILLQGRAPGGMRFNRRAVIAQWSREK